MKWFWEYLLVSLWKLKNAIKSQSFFELSSLGAESCFLDPTATLRRNDMIVALDELPRKLAEEVF